jgi:hypothetical protein
MIAVPALSKGDGTVMRRHELDTAGTRFRRLGSAGAIAVLCLATVTPSASADVLTFEKTGKPISEFALTGGSDIVGINLPPIR